MYICECLCEREIEKKVKKKIKVRVSGGGREETPRKMTTTHLSHQKKGEGQSWGHALSILLPPPHSHPLLGWCKINGTACWTSPRIIMDFHRVPDHPAAAPFPTQRKGKRMVPPVAFFDGPVRESRYMFGTATTEAVWLRATWS